MRRGIRCGMIWGVRSWDQGRDNPRAHVKHDLNVCEKAVVEHTALTHLFVDGIPLSKDNVPADKSSDEGIEAPWLSAVRFLLNK